jgi:hypothetical protein
MITARTTLFEDELPSLRIVQVTQTGSPRRVASASPELRGRAARATSREDPLPQDRGQQEAQALK